MRRLPEQSKWRGSYLVNLRRCDPRNQTTSVKAAVTSSHGMAQLERLALLTLTIIAQAVNTAITMSIVRMRVTRKGLRKEISD